MNINISVVVPTYRRPHLLRKCLDALRRQTYPTSEFEIIIVSDGPDQMTQHVVDSFSKDGHSIRYLHLPTKKGPAAARNLGWQMANGSLIAFTDDDCLVDSTWLENFWKEYAESSGACAFTGRIIVPVNEKPTDYQRNIQLLEKAEFVTANCACSKSALEVTGGFDEQFSMAWREDTDLHFKLIENNIPITNVKEAVVVHPVRVASWGISIKEQKKSMYNALLYKKYPSLYREKIQRSAPWNYYVIVSAFIAFIVGFIFNHDMLTVTSLFVWSTFTLAFVWKRLSFTRHTTDHVLEMVATSLVIPFLSVFWRCYGSLKYRTLFI
jgi:glycosyltransferase involved in cell wall biosynthesis